MATIGVVEGILRLRDEFTDVLTRASTDLQKAGKKMERVGRGMSDIGGQLTRSVTLPIVAIGGAATKFATDFESSFAGVRKTVDATEEEFAALAQGMRDLAKEQVPVDVNELNAIGEAAGQLGIQTENILSFTRTIADLGVTTNLTTEQAASDFARLANITGLPQTQFDQLGSTVVALGNTLATTESEIVNFGLRIAGAGEIAGLTEAEILGIGAAMTSVGVEAEAGGTAVQKVLLSMVQAVEAGGDELNTFATTAGLSAGEFAKAFREDAAGAFAQFVEGLGTQGTAAFKTLEDLNLQDQRLIRSFISLAGAGDLLTRAMAEGTSAFAENTALAKEAEQRYATFESQLKFTWNRIKDVAITLGTALLPVLRDGLTALEPWIAKLAELVTKFSGLSEPMKTAILSFGALAAAAGPVLLVAGQMVMAIGAITAAAPAMGTAITLATGPWGILAAAIAAVVVVTNKWISQQNQLHTEMLDTVAQTNRYGMAMNDLRLEIIAANKEQRGFNREIIEKAGKGLAGLKKRLDDARKTLDAMGDSTAHLTRTVRDGGQVVVTTSEAYRDQAGIVRELQNEFDATNRMLSETADEFIELTRETDKANTALTTTAKTVGEVGDKLRLKSLEIESLADNFDYLEEIVTNTREPFERLEEVADKLTETTDDLADSTEEATGSFSEMSDGFAQAVAAMVLQADSLGDALEAIFVGRARDMFTKFTESFTNAFSKGMDGHTGFLNSLKAGWKEAKENMLGTAAGLTGGIAASSGETQDLAIGAMTAIANFAAGNWVGAIAASIGVVSGLLKKFKGNPGATAAKNYGLELSKGLIDEITRIAREIGKRGGAGAALRQKLGDIIREVGIESANDLRKFSTLALTILADLDRGFISSSMAVSALGDSLSEILSRFKAAGGTIRELNMVVNVFMNAMDQVRRGQLSAAEAAQVLNDNFAAFVDVAKTMGVEGAAAIQKIVDTARAAGIEASVFADVLKDAMLEAQDIVAQRNQFIADQSRALLAGIDQMLADTTGLTRREVEFATTAVLQAFQAMQAAGVPLTQIIEELGDTFGKLVDIGKEIGLNIPEEFDRLGKIIEVMSRGPMQRAIDQLEGMAAAAAALGNMGLLSATQFDTFGDSIRKAFRKLMRNGLDSKEALAALAPQLQLLHDLSQKYGFAVDRNTQKLIDLALAQGLIGDKGLTTEDILIRGFDRMLEGINALIVALGAVPIAFEQWGPAVDEAAREAADGFRGIADEAARAAREAADKWKETLTGIETGIDQISRGQQPGKPKFKPPPKFIDAPVFNEGPPMAPSLGSDEFNSTPKGNSLTGSPGELDNKVLNELERIANAVEDLPSSKATK